MKRAYNDTKRERERERERDKVNTQTDTLIDGEEKALCACLRVWVRERDVKINCLWWHPLSC